MIASNTRAGEIPAIHIMVVVVSPRTLHAPPALDAATMAARNPMCTLARKSWCAIAPPINAPAILSRKLESTQTTTSSVKAPFQPSGRNFGSKTGIWLFSKWRGKQCKAHEETEKVGENDPLVLDVGNKPADARSGLEPCECDFVNGYRSQTSQRDRKRVAMKNRNSQQSYSE